MLYLDLDPPKYPYSLTLLLLYLFFWPRPKIQDSRRNPTFYSTFVVLANWDCCNPSGGQSVCLCLALIPNEYVFFRSSGVPKFWYQLKVQVYLSLYIYISNSHKCVPCVIHRFIHRWPGQRFSLTMCSFSLPFLEPRKWAHGDMTRTQITAARAYHPWTLSYFHRSPKRLRTLSISDRERPRRTCDQTAPADFRSEGRSTTWVLDQTAGEVAPPKQ